ncbi:ACP S-malonyltransferase [Nitratireductor arenosus]|nr:ACP S-malonyltransferase [Nitratireductor arenosus]
MEAFIFPGQGSQHRGMGGEWFEHDEFRRLEGEIDQILGYSIRALCLEDQDGRLRQTQFTQPALYVVNALHYFRAMRENGLPSYVAGHSLGEFNALFASGVFDFHTGLRLVKKRGELMGQARGGAMAAVIGPDAETLAGLIEDHALSTIDIANHNSPSQTIISGPEPDIEAAETALKPHVDMFIPLPVSAAFHSRYMQDAADAFRLALADFSFGEPRVGVMSNVTAQPYPAENGSAAIKDLLARQITSPVRWQDTVRHLRRLGVTEFREVGPGNVLTKLVAQVH